MPRQLRAHNGSADVDRGSSTDNSVDRFCQPQYSGSSWQCRRSRLLWHFSRATVQTVQ